MKTISYALLVLSLGGVAQSADEITYTNYIRQFQSPTNVVWDSSSLVAPTGNRQSELTINPTGARFELWTIANTSPPKEYLLSTAYVGSYVPVATVNIRTEDTKYTLIPRTRVDRPFWVDVVVDGLLNGATDPVAAKSVKFTRHTQSYGIGGTGVNIDRKQAILQSQSVISRNGSQTVTVSGWGTQITGWADPKSIRGEERFTVFSIEDRRDGYVVPETPIAEKFVQVWPMSRGSVTGITSGATYKMMLPQLKVQLSDLYPDSTTFLHVYKGSSAPGTSGIVIPGSSIVQTEGNSLPSSPDALVIEGRRYDSVFNDNGVWTMELLSASPFDVKILDSVTFNIDRRIKVNGAFTTIE